MKAIPVPMCERILKLYDQGKSTGEIAASTSRPGACWNRKLTVAAASLS
jgi:hypothetical protein